MAVTVAAIRRAEVGAEVGRRFEQATVELHQVRVEGQDHERQVDVHHADHQREWRVQHVQGLADDAEQAAHSGTSDSGNNPGAALTVAASLALRLGACVRGNKGNGSDACREDMPAHWECS